MTYCHVYPRSKLINFSKIEIQYISLCLLPHTSSASIWHQLRESLYTFTTADVADCSQ